jgi:plasmid maintenance system killer protein
MFDSTLLANIHGRKEKAILINIQLYIMRTIQTTLYKFNELSEAAQKKAITEFYSINIEHDWFDFIFEDAKNIGLKINEFDNDRGYCKGKLLHSLTEVCDLIITNHGESCETHKTAKSYLKEWDKLVAEHSDGIQKDKVCEDKEYEFDKLADELDKQFRLSLCEDYRIILQHEYEYQTSDAAIKETIIANDYEFTIEGNFHH